MSSVASPPYDGRRCGRFSPAFHLLWFALQVACVCAARFPPSIGLWVLLGLAAADAALTRVPVAVTLRRLSPLLGFVLIGLLLLVVVPPPQATVLLPLPWVGGYLPAEGTRLLGAVAVKSVAVVLLAGALATRLDEWALLDGLTALHLPALVVGVLYLTVRSLHTVGESVAQLVRSRDARGRPGGTRAVRVAAAMALSLIVRTASRAEVTGLAMTSRGFAGRLPITHTRPLTALELSIISLAGVFLVWIALT